MRRIFLLVLIASFSLSALADELTVIGMDNDGTEIHAQVQDTDYKKLINYEMEQSEELIDHQVVMNPNFRNKLLLRTVMIGFGVDGTVKLGPYSVGSTVNHQFYFDIIR
jgi:hypothetical protein